MIQRFSIFISIFYFSIIQSHSQIVADISSGCTPLTVQFTAPAGMSTYYWDFDNGGSSTDQNPAGVIFNTPKNPYKVTLRACKTCPELHSYDITVFPKPTITLSPVMGCAPKNISIAPTINLPPGVTTTSIKYIYSDGSTNTLTAPNASPDIHSFNAGTHSVTVELKTAPNEAGCNTLVTIPDVVKLSNLNVGIIANPSSGCSVPLTVNFNVSLSADRPIVSYAWDFGNGQTATTKTPSTNYTVKGSYTVTLVVKDDYGCEKTVTKPIIITENDLTRIISVDTICINQWISLDHDGNLGMNSTWNLPGSTLGTIVPSNPCFANYTTVGEKTISITTSYSGNCPKTITKKIYVIDPEVKYTVTPKPLCNLSNTFTITCTNPELFQSITWRIFSPDDPFFSKNISTSFSETVTFKITDLDTFAWQYKRLYLEINAQSKYGCARTKIDTNFISPIIAHVLPTKTQGCAPLKIGFYDKTTRYRKDTIVEWKMHYGDGIVDVITSPFDTVFHTYTTRGNYNMYMVVKNKHGCFDTTYFTKIKVGNHQTPDFTIAGSGSCASDPNAVITLQSLQPTTTAQITKFWGDGFQCIQSNTVSYKPRYTAGTFNIKMEVSDNGCFDTVVKSITVKGPIAKFNYTQSCDSLKKVVFTNLSQDANTYLWDYGDGNTSMDTNTSHKYLADGKYTVKLIAYHATNGCPADTYKLQVQIQSPNAVLDRDSFTFCTNGNQIVTAKNSSGYIKDKINTGFIWEFAKPVHFNFRSYSDTFNYNYQDTIKDTVFLTIRNFMNCISRDTAKVVVDRIDAIPTISPKLICNGDTVKFNGNEHSFYPMTSTGWTYDDGFNSPFSKDSHEYKFNPTKLKFFPRFTASNKIGCVYFYNDSVIVKKLGLAITSTKNMCISMLPNILSVNTNYACTYKWLLPDLTSTFGQSINYTFPAQAKYPFLISAVDISNNNCVDTVRDTVFAWNKPDLYINSDKDALNTLCNPVSLDLKFVDTNHTTIIPTSISWQRINAMGNAYFYNASPSTPLSIGNNKFILIASNAFCSDTATRNFVVKAPNGVVDIDRNDICKGDTITFTVKDMVDVTDYTIDFGDGTISNNISPIKHKYTYVPLGGKTKAKVIFATNGNECIGPPVDTTIRIYEVFAKFGVNFNGDTEFCKKPVHIKDSSIGANKYQWIFGDGSTSIIKEPGFKNYSLPGSYKIKLFIENTIYGCKDTFEKNIRLIPLPILKLKNDTTCQGDTTKVYIGIKEPKVEYNWRPNNLFLNPKPSDTNKLVLQNSINITLVGSDSVKGCMDSIKAQIMIVRPIKPYHLDTIIAPGADVLLPFDFVPNYSSVWIPDSFLSCLSCANPLATYILNPIQYKVIFRDLLKNCFSDSSTYKIRIFPEILVNAPTAFTPNGDGNNDVYYARGFGIKRLVSFKIYNRWGQLLFYSQSEHDGWDGYYKNVLQNSDTYFYTIVGESYIRNKIVTKEGNFMLLR
jgi:gliding motility-associated-like protein